VEISQSGNRFLEELDSDGERHREAAVHDEAVKAAKQK
jgi:hypothetical protein